MAVQTGEHDKIQNANHNNVSKYVQFKQFERDLRMNTIKSIYIMSDK